MSFDPSVRAGEIRVFADTQEPLVALILEERGLAGFRIVPVSPYRVAANDREFVVGERVLQLWNVCTVAKGFAARSWTADALTAEEVGRVRREVAERGGLPAKLGEYERRHLVTSVDFRRHLADVRKPSVSRWLGYGGWSIAAAVVLGLGVSWVMLRDEPNLAEASRVITVRMAQQQRYPDLETSAKDTACEAAEPVPEIQVEASRLDAPMIAKVEHAPDVRKAPNVAKLEPKRMARFALNANGEKPVRRDNAAAEEPVVTKTLEWLRKTQKDDGSWGERPLKDTALAVIALIAHGETADSAAYGRTLVSGVRFLAEAKLDGQPRGDIQIVACALCGASAAVRNPNVRFAAERTLVRLGDNRSVEAGRDWRGLLVDLATPVGSRGERVATGHSDGDPVADGCIHMLRLLLENR